MSKVLERYFISWTGFKPHTLALGDPFRTNFSETKEHLSSGILVRDQDPVSDQRLRRGRRRQRRRLGRRRNDL